MSSQSTYQSYLVRFWRASPQGTWRASVQSTIEAEKVVFVEIDSLFEFLLLRLTTDREISDHPDWIAADSTG